MHPIARVLISSLLLTLVLASGVHYANESANHYPYPDTAELKSDPGTYVDETVFVFGTVVSTDENAKTAQIRIDSDEGPFTARVSDFETQQDFQSGGTVQVFGTFRGEYEITAKNVRVVNPSGSSDIYKYAVSGVAALLIVVLFFRYWRMNVRKITFEARNDG